MRPETTLHGCPWTLLLSEPGRGHRAFKRALLHDIARARNIQIISSYFVPTWRLRRALMRAARRGARVQLILSGQSDIEICRLASRSLYARLLRAGVEIDDVIYAGSANLDARSLNINHELVIRIAAPETAAKARLLFEGDLAHCCPVDAKNWQTSRSFLTRLLEKAAYLLVARIDPHFTSLRWRTLVRKAFEPGVEASKKTRRSPYLPPFSG